jgi:predicted ribosome quality control (RQC) complex YloA/Tae2 family protein
VSLNWKEIDQILEELSLNDSFLQEIRQYDFHHLLFQFYGRQEDRPGSLPGETMLLVSLHPGALRLHRTERKRKALPRPPRFTTFLKARIKGGKTISVRQLGCERIILFEILRGGEKFHLYIKLWENNANIIITDGKHIILDCFSRRPNKSEVPGKLYNPEKNLDAMTPEYRESMNRFSLRENDSEGDFNQFIELFYGRKEKNLDLGKLRQEAERSLKAEKKRLTQRKSKLEDRIIKYNNLESYRKWGDRIMANLYTMKRGDSRLELQEWDEEGREYDLVIELDPKISPVENGELYYKRYKKALAGKELAAEEMNQVERRVSELDKLLAELPEEQDRETLNNYITLEKQRKGKNESPTPGLQFHSGPFLLLVGRNSQENDELLRRHVRGNDLWLHNRDWPGGYVFIKTVKGKSVPLDTLLDGGNLAIHYSRGKKAGRADLYYTEVKYLRRAKGAPLGTVIPIREKNLHVKLDEKRIKRLLKS